MLSSVALALLFGQRGLRATAVLSLAACQPSLESTPLVRSLQSTGASGIAVVIQQDDCESRSSELKILASRLPNAPVVLLRTRGAPVNSWERSVKAIFPESRHTYHVIDNAALLVRLGVSATPAVIEGNTSSAQIAGSPLSQNRSQLLSQIRDWESRYAR